MSFLEKRSMPSLKPYNLLEARSFLASWGHRVTDWNRVVWKRSSSHSVTPWSCSFQSRNLERLKKTFVKGSNDFLCRQREARERHLCYLSTLSNYLCHLSPLSRTSVLYDLLRFFHLRLLNPSFGLNHSIYLSICLLTISWDTCLFLLAKPGPSVTGGPVVGSELGGEDPPKQIRYGLNWREERIERIE